LATALGTAAYIIGSRSGIEPPARQPMSVRLQHTWSAGGVLLLPVLILGGIFSGLFTATEASAVACVYSLGLAIFQYRVPLKELPQMLTSSAATAGMIMLILAAATV